MNLRITAFPLGTLARVLLLQMILSLVGLELVGEESLIENPPFKQIERVGETRAQDVATQGSINEQYELSGIININGSLKFSIFNKQTNESFWLALNEREAGLQVERYEPDAFGVVVTQGGRREMLVLREAQKRSAIKSNIPSFRNTQTPKAYPKPPPSLPKPNELIEQLRKKREK